MCRVGLDRDDGGPGRVPELRLRDGGGGGDAGGEEDAEAARGDGRVCEPHLARRGAVGGEGVGGEEGVELGRGPGRGEEGPVGGGGAHDESRVREADPVRRRHRPARQGRHGCLQPAARLRLGGAVAWRARLDGRTPKAVLGGGEPDGVCKERRRAERPPLVVARLVVVARARLGDRRQLCRREDVARIRHAVLDADAGGGGARRHLREPIHSLRCEETLFTGCTGCLPAAICASQSPPRLADCVSGAKWSSS
mmetsp:Transcript_6516/g.21591  ORF Transcript_6516/g.21591 Transcript_6516/m.21591 type:complete len:253 (-) Transcript_6516:761-1519(-)